MRRSGFADRLNGIEGGEARDVLARRGIGAETARAFGLGFSPDSRGKLRQALHGYGDAMLVEAGAADPGRGQGAL
ncbi:MAG: hypothetical protein WDN24_03315 [Sphingomonas sp.]